MKTIIFRNSAKCLNCDTEIQSVYRNDFVACECGDVFVEGGFDYLRHGYVSMDTYLDTSLTHEVW